jgi:tetratricopeptide (TPR) repeat protein
MKTFTSLLAALSLVLATAVSAQPTPPAPPAAPAAPAAPAPPDAPKPVKKERKATGSLSEGTYRQIERIQELIGKNQNAEALQKANDLLGRLSGAYEKAIVYQTVGFIYATQNNYTAALKAFEDALALDALPQQPYEQMLFNTGQMYYANNQTDKALARLNQYFAEAVNPPPPDAHIMLASILAEKKRFAEALPHVDSAIAGVKAPKESWVQLRLALHYELKQIAACAEDLVLLIQMAPTKKDYWKQLSSVFFEIKKDQESLAVLALAERQGFLTEENEFRNLANVYLLLEIPYKAAKVLQMGIDRKILKPDEKTLTTLGDSWIMAREYDKAEEVLKQAAALSDKGDIYYRLGQIYVEDEHWKQALEVLDKAMSKSLKNPGDAVFLAGVSAFQSGDEKRAVGYLQRALQFEGNRNQATQWLNHIRMKAEASAALAANAEAVADTKKQEEAVKKQN